jgi:hypothetical protein
MSSSDGLLRKLREELLAIVPPTVSSTMSIAVAAPR